MTTLARQPTGSSRKTLAAALGLFAALLVLPLALAPRAEGFIYWTNPDLGIGRANLDGTGVNPRFMKISKEESYPAAIALDADHVYWAKGGIASNPGIGRADLDGTDRAGNFINRTDTWSLAVDANHVYWPHAGAPPEHSDAGIERANIDGTGVDESFIRAGFGFNPPSAVAVDADHVYWTQTFDFPTGGISRASLDGTGVDQSFITGANGAGGIALDAQHVYWTNQYAGTIGRANLDGTGVDQNYVTAADDTLSVAVDTDHVYWTQAYYQDGYQRGSIGRANLDGTGVDQTFIRTKKVPFDLAVDGLTDTKLAGRASAPRTQRQGGKKAVVEVKVRAKERLTAKATGKVKVNPTYELRPQQVDLATGETKTLTLEPRKKAQATLIAAALKRGKKATAKLTVKLTDVAGNSETEKLSVRLKR